MPYRDDDYRANRGDRNDRGYDNRGPRAGGGNRRRGVPLSELDPELTEMSRRVIGASIEVHKELGPGYPRDIYANALANELEAEEITFTRDHPFDVQFEDIVAGQVVSDFYVGERFLVMVRAFHGEVGSAERNELRAQLRAADLELGLIINFGERRLKDGLVRVLNPDKIAALQGDREQSDDEYEQEEAGEEAAHAERDDD